MRPPKIRRGASLTLRKDLDIALKDAMKAREERAVSTLRLILAALKDRDIAARGKGRPEGVTDDEILQMLQTMVRQRHESIEFYEKGGRQELAQQEREEIAVIERFLPRQLEGPELDAALKQAIEETGAKNLKDMGKIMAKLRADYAGRMDFAKASALIKSLLA